MREAQVFHSALNFIYFFAKVTFSSYGANTLNIKFKIKKKCL